MPRQILKKCSIYQPVFINKLQLKPMKLIEIFKTMIQFHKCTRSTDPTTLFIRTKYIQFSPVAARFIPQMWYEYTTA